MENVMKFQDLTQLLEQDESIFIPRRVEDRQIRRIRRINQYIQDYIKRGSKGDLDVSHTPITSLPSNLKYVGGNLHASGSLLQSLPDGLHVEGHLILSFTPLKQLPKGLVVGKNINLYDTQITHYPDNIIVGGTISLGGTPLQSLPDGLTVNDSLDLYKVPMTVLPNKLVVKGDLDLFDSNITHIPNDIKVGNVVYLVGTPISRRYSEKQIMQMCPGITNIYIT
jgi:hypothetical protein